MFNATLDDTWVQLHDIAPGSIEGFLDAALVDWGIWDAGLTLEQKKKRYVCFAVLEFGVAPPEVWPALCRELLEFEPFLACQ